MNELENLTTAERNVIGFAATYIIGFTDPAPEEAAS